MDKPIGILPPGLESLSKDRLNQPKSEGKLGQDAFLELMITQLKHQDPLKPMENGDFLGQMAQFGTVNGITELTKSFSLLASSLQSNQALQASTMVGREVLIDGSRTRLREDGTAKLAVDLPPGTTNVTVTIEDPIGQRVRELPLGARAEGIVEFEWDGFDAQGNRVAPGPYVLKAEALVDGRAQAVPTLVHAPVESVTLSRDGKLPVLNVTGVGAVDLADVRRVM